MSDKNGDLQDLCAMHIVHAFLSVRKSLSLLISKVFLYLHNVSFNANVKLKFEGYRVKNGGFEIECEG